MAHSIGILIVFLFLSAINAVAIMLNFECTTSSADAIVGVANCSRQHLAHVPANLPHNIRVLDLSNNQITQLQDNAFVKYELLEMLHLHNNSLSRLETRVFNRLRSVMYLDLSYNNIAEIPSQAFRDLKSLLTLSLLGNKIVTIHWDAFGGITKLTNLFLSGNHIQSIHPNAFTGLRNLQYLELQNNALSQLNGSSLESFQTNLKEIKLFNNPWFCDCNLRWLIQWLKNSSETDIQRLRWKFGSEEPMCNGPSIIDQRLFSSLTGEWFLCPIRMYSKARNQETLAGGEVELFCKYSADPRVDIQWLRNGQPLDLSQKQKYKVDYEGTIMTTSRLYIFDFGYGDIGEYECYAENKLGRAFDSCLVTIQGVDPSIALQPTTKNVEDDKDRVRNAIIASSTIGGVMFLLIIVLIIFCCIKRCKRYHRRKKESIRMSFEEHLKANGFIEPSLKKEPVMFDDVADRTPSLEDDLEEPGSVYDSLQRPRQPSSVNTNTYISFKTEFSEPEAEEETQLNSEGHQTTASTSKTSDGSQCESTSPLLENISPILIDPNDPFYEEANLYVPRFYASTNNYLHSTPRDLEANILNGLNSAPRKIQRFESEFIPVRDVHGFILPSMTTLHTYHSATLPQNGHVPRIPHRTHTLPHGFSAHHMPDYKSNPAVRSNSMSINHRSSSVGYLGTNPPKKPPRSFQSRDTVSLHSQSSFGEEGGLKLSLPKPGSVDGYGTAV
ncbi:leucine-rich repeat-containing protein 24-like [Dreissena polymorpha]|uniref:leucine-rich repeat-containing protein 24-like n=1 Tax=Dreissena polymorpha TaxID=45954 RepID=UPI002264F2EF|nr:leucine-rich repeat-containing protein 24-like [Dreissena polymorpha]XP_052283460.1 leucine-rich repeat-containing protein 24-like [Dreissena polymorpha]XP_052283461.1 leucine-rich repeat-containing protein 24-like [Dreissena polymorpha]XP_052283462.1 leucine-rich repeat-containing protein 24-like [Dreissena polymorpha]XP_052283463.1 leucine-rich repeat-containing protein 24-like [Dreissena polymorpha]XP_052283464.1 leucine-rich repeat-containing protein 24-like [Dreissena polymorpha]XP_05